MLASERFWSEKSLRFFSRSSGRSSDVTLPMKRMLAPVLIAFSWAWSWASMSLSVGSSGALPPPKKSLRYWKRVRMQMSESESAAASPLREEEAHPRVAPVLDDLGVLRLERPKPHLVHVVVV